MTERLPENLRILYDGYSKEMIDQIFGGESFTVDDVEFICKYAPESTANRFFIVKSLRLVDYYRQICARFERPAIFELGIAEGGSTALFALLAKPNKLVAVDLEAQPLPALAEFAESHGMADIVKPYYGVDQSDRRRLHEIYDREFGGGPLDLVVDDASHALDLTRSSFETLFPLLRAGGLYVIEDWRNDYVFRDALLRNLKDPDAPGHAEFAEAVREAMKTGEAAQPRAPMSQLAIELALARASVGNAVAEVSLGEYCLMITRGEGDLDRETFRLSDLYTDFFGYLPKTSV